MNTTAPLASVADRLRARGLSLPASPRVPAGVEIPFAWVRVHGDRVFVAGHGALASDGTPAPPFGKVPSVVSLEQARASARLATLAMLASLRDAIGELERIAAWLVIHGFVNADPGYTQTTAVLNPCSELILELFGSTVGAHARTAIGVAALPLNLPVVIAAELVLAP